MADDARHTQPDLDAPIAQMDFFRLLAVLETETQRFGRGGGPELEPARLGQSPRLAFATQDVASLSASADRPPSVAVNVLGLLGLLLVRRLVVIGLPIILLLRWRLLAVVHMRSSGSTVAIVVHDCCCSATGRWHDGGYRDLPSYKKSLAALDEEVKRLSENGSTSLDKLSCS